VKKDVGSGVAVADYVPVTVVEVELLGSHSAVVVLLPHPPMVVVVVVV
jgi:hypothetical protein